MRRLVVVAALVALWPVGAADAQPDVAPSVREIRATFSFPVTTYVVTADDPEGGPLTFTWSKSPERECGEFTGDGNRAEWSHPHPPCPEESFHPGTITVQVSDGRWIVEAAYPHGSEEGVVTFDALPATPVATTTTTNTSTTSTTTMSTTTTVIVGDTLPLGEEEDDGGSFPIALVVGGLVGAAIIAGWLARRRSGDPCDELRRRCAEATAAMHQAGRALDAAVAAVGPARDRDRLAQARLERASHPPSHDEETFVESVGVRITQHDLNLRVRAAGEMWARYRNGVATAEEVEQAWGDMDAPGAREARRSKDEADRARRLADAQAEAAAAAAALADAMAAQAAAESAYAAGVAAQRDACAAAAECERTAAGATSAPPPSPAPPTTNPPPPPRAPVPAEESSQEPCVCGPDFTDAFIAGLNIIIGRLRREGPPPLVMDVVDAAWYFSAAPSPVVLRGLTFMYDNGGNMDLGAATVTGCPRCIQCGNFQITLNGVCVAPHTCNDSVYGLCCGWFGIPLAIQHAGGQWAEWQKGGPSLEDLNIEPQVSRDLYAAGSRLGERARADASFVVTASDLDGIIAVATKSLDCPPCATKAPAMKDFSKIRWIW